MSTQIPSRLVGGRYRLVAPLGRGGMGTVWSAVDETLGRQVAIKEVTPPPELDDLQRSQLRERTLREARAAARIDSAAAVTVYDVVEEDGRPWIVMQLVPARTLADVIRDDGPLPDRDVAQIGLRVLEALIAAHAAGVLHRDVKPANVLIPASGHAVLSDFGIASLEGDASMTTTGMLIGSPAYMAPERARGVAPSPASDLWSLGATLFTALRGRSPFERDGQIPTLLAVMHDETPQVPASGPLAEAIQGMLRKDPNERLTAPAAIALLTRAAAAATASPAAATVSSRPQLDRTQLVPVLPETPLVAYQAAPSTGMYQEPIPSYDEPIPSYVEPVRTYDEPVATYQPATSHKGRRGPVALALALLVAGGLAAVALWPRHAPSTSPGPAAVTSAKPRATPSASAHSTLAPARSSAVSWPAASTATSPATSPASTSSTPAVSVSVSPSFPGGAPAAGFTAFNSGAYQVDVPQGWTQSNQGARTYFKHGRSFLLIERGGAPNGDPVQDWFNQEPGTKARLAGYQRIRIVPVSYKNFSSADWEFTWQPSGGQLHVLDRNIVNGNHAYAVYWSVPEAEWVASQATLQHIFDSFTPTE